MKQQGWIVGLFCAVLPVAMLAAGDANAPHELTITAGKSLVIDYPEDLARISTSNPEVLDYVPASSREILLHGKSMGVATLVVWSKSGHRTYYSVSVEQNLSPLKEVLNKAFPGEQIDVLATKDAVALVGNVSSQTIAERAAAMASPLAKNVVNHLSVKAAPVEKQILLRVKFAELNRTAAQSFGVNLISTGALNTPGTISTGQFGTARMGQLKGVVGAPVTGTETSMSITDALNIFAFRPDLNLAAAVKALHSQGVLQILAEPNLVTSNGKEASFLVGGEFPIPVLQGGANAGAITVQFREFGIRLTFNPLLTANGTLKMFVRPEVSTIDISNAITVSGFTIPALATRRIESTIELGPGQSFVIGGLIDDRANESLSKIPGLGSIPILGALFRSRNENRTKSELIVMVTPEVIEPLEASDPRLKLNHPMQMLRPSMLPQGVPGSKPSEANEEPVVERKRLFDTSPVASEKK